MDALLGQVPWFPQQYAETFFVAKGVVALVAACCVVGHMAHTWNRVTAHGQRLRYFSLLAFVFLLASSSVEQVQDAELVDYRNLGAVVVLALTISAMAVSIREDVLRDRSSDRRSS